MPSIWTRQELTEQIALWKEAYKACATGKAYTIGNRSLTRYDLAEIRKQLDLLAEELAALDGFKGPVFVAGIYRR